MEEFIAGCSIDPLPGGQQRVLVVDDDESLASLYSRLLKKAGYQVRVKNTGEEALKAAAEQPPDVVVLDVMMPGMSGFDVCRTLKRDPTTRLIPVVLVTSLTGREEKLTGLNAGADDFIRKPVDQEELLVRVRSLARFKRFTDDLDSAASIIMTLAVMIEGRDGYAEGHCHRLANFASAMGRSLGLSSDEIQALYRGGFLHDIGMLTIPDPVLRKVGSLTPDEFELVKTHTVVGDSLCANLRSLQAVRPIVRHHHERFDGSGYPDGLIGNDIPLLAQIMSICDAYDALTTKSPYQDAQTTENAIRVLNFEVERGWRRGDLVETFIGLIETGRIASPVTADA